MRRRRLLYGGCALFFVLFNAGIAYAESPLATDMTTRCKFYLSHKPAHEERLFDSDAYTYWQSGKSGDGYIQFLKPAGSAFLSVLWAKEPERAALFLRANGESFPMEYFGSAYGSVPENFSLPAEPGLYRLCAMDCEMAVAELRVHTGRLDAFMVADESRAQLGETEHFFERQGYPASPTLSQTKDRDAKPIRRNNKISQRIRQAQQRLRELGYYGGAANGVIGSAAYLSLLRFQRVNGLFPSGAYDSATARMLEDPLALSAPTLPAALEKPPRNASALVDFLYAHLGDGYVYGGGGEISTPTVRGAAARLFPEYKPLLTGYARRWDGLPVFDCTGLLMAFLDASKGAFPDRWRVTVNGAASRWMTEIGPIHTMPRQPGLLLLQEDPDKPNAYMHIGAYVGDGWCIHARGHRYGVVREPMPQLWTHWARPIWLEMDIAHEPRSPWPQYMGSGSWVIADSSTGDAVQLYSKPNKGAKYRTGVSLPNYTELMIESVPPDLPYWRVATVPDAKGNPVTGYVYARDLSVIQ